jgi:hypothetical protein
MAQGQHYVPRIYLQRFAYSENGDMWGLKIKGNYPGSSPAPKRYNKSEICKLTDFYNLNDLATLKEKNAFEFNYVEKYGFPYENSELKRVFDLLEYGPQFFHSDAYRLLVILFNLKRRNPTFLNFILNHPNESLDEFVDQAIGSIKEDFAKSEFRDLPIDFEQLKEEQKEKMRKSDHRSDMHKHLLIDSLEVNDEGEKERMKQFLSYQFILFSTTPDVPFVISDNPGFTLTNSNQVFNLDIGHTHKMVFPISALSSLVINFNRDPSYSNILLNKNINKRKADPIMVDFINQGTACTCMDYIYSGTPDALTITQKSWQRNNS